MPVCYEELVAPVVFNIEAFKPREVYLEMMWHIRGWLP